MKTGKRSVLSALNESLHGAVGGPGSSRVLNIFPLTKHTTKPEMR